MNDQSESADSRTEGFNGSVPGKISWIASYPKSGNTFVRALIQAFVDGDININRLDAVQGDSGLHLWQALVPSDARAWSTHVYTNLRPAQCGYMAYLSSFSKTAVWKTHWANGLFDNCPSIPPAFSHKVVYLVRDPRNVCVSLADHFGMSIPETMKVMLAENFVLHSKDGYAQQVVSSWRNHVEGHATKPSVPVLVVKYEDLLRNTADEFGQIVEFLELDGRVGIGDAVDKAHIDLLRRMEAEHGFSERREQKEFFTEPDPEKWQGKLSPEQTRVLLKEVKALPTKFAEFLGYG